MPEKLFFTPVLAASLLKFLDYIICVNFVDGAAAAEKEQIPLKEEWELFTL